MSLKSLVQEVIPETNAFVLCTEGLLSSNGTENKVESSGLPPTWRQTDPVPLEDPSTVKL